MDNNKNELIIVKTKRSLTTTELFMIGLDKFVNTVIYFNKYICSSKKYVLLHLSQLRRMCSKISEYSHNDYKSINYKLLLF